MASGRLADILLPSTPTLGDPKASVLMIEFSDFTCGYCGRFYRETLPALKAEYLGAGKVRFAYRDYPRDPEGWTRRRACRSLRRRAGSILGDARSALRP